MGKWVRLLWLGCLWWLLALSVVPGAAIFYEAGGSAAYGRLLADRTGQEVRSFTASQLWLRLPEEETLAVEAYDVQAAVLQENHLVPYYWYPHYTATVVLAVADDCPFPITGWQSLASAPVSLALMGDAPARIFFVQAISYGLDGDVSGQAGIELLRRFQDDGHLQMDLGDAFPLADVYILYDYQARQWQHRGAPIHLVVPEEGTLAFRKGLVSKQPLELDNLKLSEAMRTSQYTTTPPPQATFISNISDAETFLQASEDIPRQIKYRVLKVYKKNILTGINHMVWYLGTLFFVILWGCRLRRQVLQTQVRQAYLGVIITLCAWVLLRGIKLSLPDFWHDGIRWSWYSYYLFFCILISLLVWIGYTASHNHLNRPCPGWLKGIFAGNLILAAAVMTNDFHQLAFTLPADLAVADSQHGYGPLYFILAITYNVELLAVNAGLCYASLRQQVSHLCWLFLPLACTLGYEAYLVGYVLGISWCRLSEIVLVTIWWTLVWLEIVTKGRFVPANEGYVEFFRHSNLAMQLCDDTGRVVYASRDVAYQVQDDWEAQSMPIRGGWVRWYRDIRPLRERQAALHRINRALTRSYELLCRLGDIRRQSVDQRVKLRIYGELEDIIARKRPAIEHRLAYLETARPGPETDAVISRLHVLACYLKKRCVLLLRGQEDGTLDARELALAVQELQHYLERAGLRGRAGFDLKGSLPALAALTLYDVFEDTGEAVLAQGEVYWLCQFRETDRDWVFSLVLEASQGEDWLPSWQGLAGYAVTVSCDDTGYGRRLTVHLAKEGFHG